MHPLLREILLGLAILYGAGVITWVFCSFVYEHVNARLIAGALLEAGLLKDTGRKGDNHGNR